jgi:hypothetical protein
MAELVERAVEFSSQGATLRGFLMTSTADDVSARRPCVILGHGTSATLQMVAIEYARSFARAGLAALIYDHRNLGSSDGEPRGEINPWVQCRGFLDALSFAETQPEVDAERIALWGDSFAGGEVLLVAACDPRPKAVIAQTPSLGAAVPDLQPTDEALRLSRDTLLRGDVSGGPTHTTGPLPVVSFDPASIPSLLLPIQAFRWFIDYGGRPGSGWQNRVTRVAPPTPIPFLPFVCAPFVKARTMFMVASDDEMAGANPFVSRTAFDLMVADKVWCDIRGGHFGLIYYPSEMFAHATAVQADFLRETLLAS